jgi:DNA-binding Lrp family transcriptional regulator
LVRRWRPSERKILSVLADGAPKSHNQIVKATGLTGRAVWACLRRCWRNGLILRSKEPLRESHRAFKGRAGVRVNLRSYYLYTLKTTKAPTVTVEGVDFVQYAARFLDKRNRTTSKAALVLRFLQDHSEKAYFSKDLADALKPMGVRISDIMANTRRFERKGLVYVRGYRTNERQTPFKEGYILTSIDPKKPREEAIEEAVERTDAALSGRSATSPIIERVHRIRDIIIAASKTRELVAQSYIVHDLDCSEYEAEGAIKRALQLYSDLREVKVFNAYKFYYREPMSAEDLQAAVTMKENYVRIEKGRDNRVGHNWEAAVEWFVDKFTTGASFREQPHRTAGMDPRRITLHLVKSVGGRQLNAEVDRVWTVTPGLFSPPTTYVLECKWGLVRKRDVDDFMNVLRWSKDYGVDTPEGRQLKQGVTGVFAGSAFNPDEKVTVGGQTMSLASYANRLNISLLKAADFNEKLRERGCKADVTIQKLCKACRDEKEVREILETTWRKPAESAKILSNVLETNEEVYRFEKMLEQQHDVAGRT